VKVPYRADREDLDALLAAAETERARLLYVVNPDNPMGSWWSGVELEQLIARLPGDTLLCLDEAYCDTAPPGSIPAVDIANPRVLRFRTFSKAYGLAGARIGYCIGERELIAVFEKIRNHYGINRVGQIGALAALGDQDYLTGVAAKVRLSRERIAAIANRHGLRPLASAANFVAIDCGGDGAFAKRVLDEILARDVFARKPSAPGLDRCIRVSCGQNEDLDAFEEVLPQALAAVRG
jgi:histidinol-phosphate aminotransferase